MRLTITIPRRSRPCGTLQWRRDVYCYPISFWGHGGAVRTALQILPQCLKNWRKKCQIPKTAKCSVGKSLQSFLQTCFSNGSQFFGKEDNQTLLNMRIIYDETQLTVSSFVLALLGYFKSMFLLDCYFGPGWFQWEQWVSRQTGTERFTKFSDCVWAINTRSVSFSVSLEQWSIK